MPDGVGVAADAADSMGRLEAIAAEEGCTVEDLLGRAVGLYVSLSAPARRSLRSLDRLGGPDDRAAAGVAAGRSIVQVAFDVARRAIAESGAKYAAEHGLVDEDAAIGEAVRLTREAERAVV